MGDEPTKRAVWERWVTETVFVDVDELGYFGVGVLSVDKGAEFVELAAGVLIGG